MSESPPDGGGPKTGDEDEGGGTRKKGESDPLFNPPGLKRRTTVMGLAPAPHLGGLSGSPGAIARAEAEARKQRVLTRITPSPSKRPTPGVEIETGPPPPVHPAPLREEIIEPLPPPFSAAPPAPDPKKVGSGTYVGMGPTGAGALPPLKTGAAGKNQQTVMMPSNVNLPARERKDIQDASIVTDAPSDVPNHGQSTMLMMPNTPGVPLTLPEQQQRAKLASSVPPKARAPSRPDEPPPKLPDSGGWEVVPSAAAQPQPGGSPRPQSSPDHHKPSSPGFPSAGTVLIEPARMQQQASAQQQQQQPNPKPVQQQTVLHLGAAAQQAQAQVQAAAAQRAAAAQAAGQPVPPNQQWTPGQQHTMPHQVQQVRPQTVVIPQRAPIEPPPNTERMMRVAQQQGLAAPTAALALRTWEPGGGEPSERGIERHSLSGTLDRRLILWNEPESARAASFRSLRDSLVGKGLPRVVAVSSASPHNGTTTCAINLALALTELAQTKVLLIDANFYDPILATVFTIERLTQIAPKEPWLKPYTIVAVSQSLHVAGIVKAEVTGRMEPQQRFESLIDRLCRANYDYIIVDTPALRGSAVVTLVSGADGCVLAVRAGSTTARDLRRAADQLPPKKALGVALVDGGA